MPSPRLAPFAACIIFAPLLAACSADTLTEGPAASEAPATEAMFIAPPSRCAGPTVTDGLALMPDGVQGIFGADIGQLTGGAFGKDLLDAAKGSPEGRKALEAAKKCGLTPAKLGRITVAADVGGDSFAIAIEAPGIAKDSTLDCLHKAIQDATGESPWTKTTRACTTALEFPAGDGIAFAAGNDTLVLTSTKLESKVGDLLSGTGKPAIDGGLSWAKTAVNTKRSAWFAVDATSLGSSAPMPGLQKVGGSADTARGLDLDLMAGFATRAQAESAQSQLEMLPAMGAMLGLPSGFASSMAVARSGETVTLDMSLSKGELEEIAKTLSAAM